MERPHTQHAPPQDSDDLDVPLLDLSISDEPTEPLEPRSPQPLALNSNQPRSLLSPVHSHKTAGDALSFSTMLPSAPAPAAAPAPAPAASSAMRRPSPAPVLLDPVPAPSAPAPASAIDSSSNGVEDVFHTSIPLSRFAHTVSSPSFLDRVELEMDLLCAEASSAAAMSRLYREAALDPQLANKNRYSNVLPSRRSRVLLPSEGSDSSAAASYINACLVPPLLSGCEHSCIATQAPLPHTVRDFWSMVWSQGCRIIVMLTRESERDGRGMSARKAHAYWPEAAASGGDSANQSADPDALPSATYGPFTVSLLSRHVERSLTLREFALSRSDLPGELRHVHHVQYEGWPDFGVPDPRDEGFERTVGVYRAIRAHVAAEIDKAREEQQAQAQEQGETKATEALPSSASAVAAAAVAAGDSSASRYPPVVVHCSAGIGRSGVWLAIDSLLDHLAHHSASCATANDAAAAAVASAASSSPSSPAPTLSAAGSNVTLADPLLDVFGLVRSMREHRAGMVQTPEQLAFIYTYIAAHINKQQSDKTQNRANRGEEQAPHSS